VDGVSGRTGGGYVPPMTDPTRPTEETKEAEADEARAEHRADRGPTPDEEALAPKEPDPEVAAHEREMMERGAHVEGEGRLP